MTSKADCLATLRGLIERSERAELSDAQAAIIEFALTAPDVTSRAKAMGELQADLADAMASVPDEPMRKAYYAVVDAMIDRTRDAVANGGGKAGG